jgi:exonuclease III
MPLKLLTLNIEEDKHFDLILPYLQAEKFDVICLQEIFEKDVTVLAEAAQAKALFSPLSHLNGHIWGVAMLIRQELPIHNTIQKLYKGNPEELPTFTHDNPNIVNRGIISTQIEKNNLQYRVTTTHFTWADGGGTNPDQTRDFASLENLLDEVGETILCGDFDAPRTQTRRREEGRRTGTSRS